MEVEVIGPKRLDAVELARIIERAEKSAGDWTKPVGISLTPDQATWPPDLYAQYALLGHILALHALLIKGRGALAALGLQGGWMTAFNDAADEAEDLQEGMEKGVNG